MGSINSGGSSKSVSASADSFPRYSSVSAPDSVLSGLPSSVSAPESDTVSSPNPSPKVSKVNWGESSEYSHGSVSDPDCFL